MSSPPLSPHLSPHRIVRPVLRPGLRLMTEASGRTALVDRDRAYPLDATTAALLRRLDGLVDESGVLGREPDPATRKAWARLRDTGVVVDVETPARLVRDTDPAERAAALAEVTALLAEEPTTASARWQARRRATVAVQGLGALVPALRALLRRAGVGALVATGGDADVTVLAHDHEPPTDAVEHLMRDSRPHLRAALHGAEGVVGPFVRPGATPCLRCVDLTRAQADPVWAGLRDRLSTPPSPPAAAAPPAAGVVISLAAGLVAADVLAHVEGRDPATLGATASVSAHQPLPLLRPWPAHPACGCGWQAQVSAREEWRA